MKIAICGSREIRFHEPDDLLGILSFINTFYNSQVSDLEIVSGGAKGIDSSASALAKKYKYKLKEFLPEYDKYEPKIAPLKRNVEIAEYSDILLVIHNGSGGSAHVKNQFKKLNKHVFEFSMPKLKQEI